MSDARAWGLEFYGADFSKQRVRVAEGERVEFPPGSGNHWTVDEQGLLLETVAEDPALLTTLQEGSLLHVAGVPFAVSLRPPATGRVAGACSQCGRQIGEEDSRDGRAFMRSNGPVCIGCLCEAGPQGQVLGERYEMLRELGRGGQAAVYLAADRSERRPVAVKVLHGIGGTIDRFLREARVGGRLHHPNVVQVHDAEQHAGRPYLVMEYVPGESLDHRLAEQGPLDEPLVRRVGVSVGRALQFARAVGVIHRDIKPANIILRPDGLAKLSDFGLAKQLEDSGLTATGSFLGTIPFCSPEQLADPRSADHRADLYSLGVALFQLLCGELPFTGDSRINLIWKISSQEPEWEPLQAVGVSDALRDILERLLRKNPDERVESADALVALL